MKKNVMMRVASALLVAVLMTTCAISGTFAKYTTTQTGSDSARVAKWGVVITANGQTFAKSEEGTVNGVTANTVLSTENVVAPGMSGNMVSMALAGQPEVAVKVTYAGTLTLSGWAVTGDDFYCPIIIYVNGTAVKGLEYDSVVAFKDAVEALINGYSREYAAGTNLSTVNGDSLAVSWEWAFEGDDVKDTALGDAAAAGNASTIELAVVTTVTQVN